LEYLIEYAILQKNIFDDVLKQLNSSVDCSSEELEHEKNRG
jgi:hypothetical protein